MINHLLGIPSPSYKDHRPAMLIKPSNLKDRMVTSRHADDQKPKITRVEQPNALPITFRSFEEQISGVRRVSKIIEEVDHGQKRLKLKDYLHLREIQRSKSTKSGKASQGGFKSNKHKKTESLVPQKNQSILKIDNSEKMDDYFECIKEEVGTKFKKQCSKIEDIQQWIIKNLQNNELSKRTEGLLFMFQLLERVDDLSKLMQQIGKVCKAYSNELDQIKKNVKVSQQINMSQTKQNERSFFWEQQSIELKSPAKIIRNHTPTKQFSLLNTRV